MTTLARLAALAAWTAAVALTLPAAADYEGATGYGPSDATHDVEVSHDGYPRGGEAPGREAVAPAEPPSYVIIEVEDGATQEVEGETVIVVQEPEPVAATEVAPPPPRVDTVEQPAIGCSEGIWVDGYWTYGDGEYAWVDGHCVVERVNYVFVHPRWDFYSSVWWFVPGYYRPCSAWVGFGYYRPYYWFPPYHRPYYRGHRGVPVHRGVPRRPTVRGVTPTNRVSTARRQPPRGYGRTPTVNRAPTRVGTVNRAPTRAPTVNRPPPTRTGAVRRVPPTRTGSVTRVPPTRTGSVTRVPPTRTGSVTRVPPTRTSSVVRVPPTRTDSVRRAPSTRAPNVSRSASPQRPSTSPRFGGFSGRSSSGPSRTSAVRRPSMNRPSSSGVFGGSRMTPSRSSFGRSGGFGRPSSGGFGGARSVPTARGR